MKELDQALTDYRSDLETTQAARKRLGGWVGELNKGLRKPDASAGRSELKVIGAQIDRLEEADNESKRRYYSKIDAINAKLVQRIRMLASLPSSNVGLRLLLAECDDFEKAGNDFVARDAIFAGICHILEGVAQTKSARASFSDRSRSAGAEEVTHCESPALVDQHPLCRFVPAEAKSPFQFKF